MKNHHYSLARFFFIPISLLLAIFITTELVRFADGGKRRIEIPDDLEDVVDDEEDDAWKEWGKKRASPEFDIHPSDLEKMDMSEIQSVMMKQQRGLAMGFVKLRLGIQRTREMVAEIAMKWTKVLRTGAVEVKFVGVDPSTIMFTLERGQDTEELKEFVLSQRDAYEMKIGDSIFRRPGDPPLEEVVKMLKMEKKGKADDLKEEL